jgi:seryl-tRNA synthetase
MSVLSKNLPQSPAEASSNDLISSLKAQIENLQHRRNNIAKSIHQMTELMPQDRLTITNEVRRKREEEKRKVESLKEEEADIKREEHELGLKLHRAYKRRDKDAVYEPTTLWVRRVTG